MVLSSLRKKIDDVDLQLLELLARRLKISREIAEYKRKNDLPVHDLKRELEIITKRIEQFKQLGFDDETFVAKLFELIMHKSREVQQ
ncbi:chorismate mutase [Candidatus Woesearchaeota archaeon]|nr:chorismate mutase [Candidatus Woesearchaeota archaeon]